MNPNDDRDRDVDQKDIDKGNKASKWNEAKRRLIANQGESILEDENLESLITQEVKRMDELAQIPQPTVKEHNIHESRIDNEAGVGGVPGKTTEAQNTQNEDAAKVGKASESGKVTAKQGDLDADQELRTANANKKS